MSIKSRSEAWFSFKKQILAKAQRTARQERLALNHFAVFLCAIAPLREILS
jgi:hypothetical protein